MICSVNGGKAFAMTENHHADARVESIRLRRMMGSSLITDSFGESRWMGALTNTRWSVPMNPILCGNLTDMCVRSSLGDLRYKKFGVTPEPEVRTKLLNGAFQIFTCLRKS